MKGEESMTNRNTIISDKYIEINGCRQNILIMCTDPSNPVLLIVHGGPGCPDRPLIKKYSSSLSAFYTVVCWDQRGSGLSYVKEHLTIDMLLSDLKAVVEYLREKYSQEKLYIAGHSWGAYLGVRFAYMCPDYVKYYIGTGQEISVILSETDRYLFVREQAGKRNKTKVLKKLDRFGEPEGYHYRYNDKKAKAYVAGLVLTYAGYFSKNGEKSPAGYILSYLRLYTGSYKLKTLELAKGIIKSLTTLYNEMDLNDSVSCIKELKMPVLLISGEEDMICPVPTAQRWFDSLSAPEKKYVIIKNASHMVNFEKPDEWNRLLEELVSSPNN